MKQFKSWCFRYGFAGSGSAGGPFAAASTAPDEKAKTQQHDPGRLDPVTEWAPTSTVLIAQLPRSGRQR